MLLLYSNYKKLPLILRCAFFFGAVPYIFNLAKM